MFEASTDKTVRNAMQRAHEERSKAIRDAWHWLFPSANSR